MCRISTALGCRDSLGSGRVAPGGAWRKACGGGCSGRNDDVGRYHSLNLIFSAPTATGSHDVLRSWC